MLCTAGYKHEKASPCLFVNATDDCSVMAHGDDFGAGGNKKSTEKLQTTLEAAYKVKCEVLRGGTGDLQ